MLKPRCGMFEHPYCLYQCLWESPFMEINMKMWFKNYVLLYS